MSGRTMTVYTDGGARGNPGPAAIGAVISEIGQVIHTISQTIGATTNNQAEYQAVHAALAWCQEHGATNVAVFADSELIVKQLRGEYKMKNKDLAQWFIRVQSLVEQIGTVTFTVIRREQNTAADALVNKALDLAR
jgi:ribonuclease HI